MRNNKISSILEGLKIIHESNNDFDASDEFSNKLNFVNNVDDFITSVIAKEYSSTFGNILLEINAAILSCKSLDEFKNMTIEILTKYGIDKESSDKIISGYDKL